MTPGPVPPNEAQRLEALRGYQILDTPPEEDFDELVFLAGRLCGMPMALLTVIDAHRQWVKAQVGVSLGEIPRELALCAQTILGRDVVVMPDMSRDGRCAAHPMVVGEPHIRFYAGAPLITPEGYALGTIWVGDLVPRELETKQVRGWAP